MKKVIHEDDETGVQVEYMQEIEGIAIHLGNRDFALEFSEKEALALFYLLKKALIEKKYL